MLVRHVSQPLFAFSVSSSALPAPDMALKRARLSECDGNNPWSSTQSLVHVGGHTYVPKGCVDAVKEAEVHQREFLIGKHCAGEMPAHEFTRISWLHTAAGSIGLEDLAVKPGKRNESNGAAHVKLALGRESNNQSSTMPQRPSMTKDLAGE